MFSTIIFRTCMSLAILLLGAPALVACAKPTVDVSIHAVNYSGTAFSYAVVDPAKPSSGGAGELINPFASGGTVCCFTLPKIWRTGIRVKIHETHWLPNLPDGSLPEVKKVHVVEVPKYAQGTPGELWVMRAQDGSISVISSNFQPDHLKWPGNGNLRGWPVPSLEYRRERWELIRQNQADFVENYQELLGELKKSPQARARQAWEQDSQFDKAAIKPFSGPDDPNYLIFLKDRYTEGLKRSREELARITEMRP